MEGNETTLYVRNYRPNMVIVPYAGVRYKLERRGARNDNTALPIEAQSDPTINRWLRQGILEEITKEDFIELAVRDNDSEYKLKKPERIRIKIEEPQSATPTLITKDKDGKDILNDESVKRNIMSPKLEWETEPLSTSEELAKTTGKPKGRPKNVS